MRKLIALLLLALALAGPAFGQSIQQSGTVTRNHLPVWVTSGVQGDGGSAADSPISTIGATGPICSNSARQSSGAWNSLCLQANTSSAATITLQNYGTAGAQSLQFVINGTAVTFPTGGGNFLVSSGALINGHLPCFSGTAGIIVDCGTSIGAGTAFGLPYYSSASSLGSTGAGTNGQLLVGQTSSVPLWQTLSGDVASISAGGAVTLGKVNGVPFGSTYSAHGVLIGEGTGQFNAVATSNIGQCLLSQGSSDPIWSSCAAGSGSAGGSNTQVQFNNATSLGGSTYFTWVSPTLTIGLAGSATGQLALASAGSSSGTVTIQNPSTTSAYNFNLPTTAGSSGQPLLSGGGGSTAMSFGPLGTAAGGTNCASASGTCIDNISAWASTGYVFRSGGGVYTFSTVIPVSNGGTALANGTSGGILGFTGSGTIASSGLLAQYGIVVGGGAGATPSTVTNGTAGQILQAQTSANPAWNIMSGNVTINSAGVTTIGASQVANSMLVSATGYTFKGNPTGSSAAPTDFTPASLAAKASPAAGDYIVIADNAASGALKYATISSIASAGSVASIAGNTGSFTLAGGVTNSTNQIQMDGNYTGFANSNCTLAASVGSNLLTVNLVNNAGSTPSSTSPCYLNFRSATTGNGTTSLSTVTAATSISTFATGATLGSANATAFRFWVVAFNNAGAVFLGLFNASNGVQCFPIDETQVQSSTSMTSGSTSAGVYYSPNGLTATNLPIRILGYVEYNSSGLATAGTYTSGPNFIQPFGPGVKKPCETVSISYNITGSVQTSSGAAYPTATGFYLNKAFTSAANLGRISASTYGANGTNGNVVLGLYQSTGGFSCSTAVGQPVYMGNSSSASYWPWAKANIINKPNSTSPYYGVCFGVNTAAGSAGGGDLTVEEIMG